MEFLDDLIKNQDTNEQTEQEPEDAAWNDLINGMALEDPYDQGRSGQNKNQQRLDRNRKSRKRARSRKGSGSRRRKRVLTILAVSIFIVWGLIFAVILRMRDSNTKPRTTAPSVTGPTTPVTVTEGSDNALTPPQTPAETGVDSIPVEESDVVPESSPKPPSIPDAPFTRFDREIQENPEFIDLYQLRGQEYIDKAAYEAALADFQYVLAKDENRAEAYAGMGRVYFHMRRWNEAERAFQSSLGLNEELSTAHFWLGHIYFYKGAYKAAFQAYDMAAEYDRSNAAAEAWLAFTSAELGDYYETLGAVTRAMSITKELSVVFVASSWENLLNDPPDIDGAQGDLLYARELEPNNFITLNALASFYLDYRPERLAEAELLAHYAQNWAQNDIEKAIALHTLGRIYLVKGLNADAEKVLIQAMDLSTVDGFVILPDLPDDFNRSRE